MNINGSQLRSELLAACIECLNYDDLYTRCMWLVDLHDPDLSNGDWMLKSIQIAKNVDRLKELGHILTIDKEAGVDYTLDEGFMESLRAAWAKRKKEVSE